jgi:hypothetical protein
LDDGGAGTRLDSARRVCSQSGLRLMPGSMWEVRCPTCHWWSEVRTGAFMPRAPGEGVHYRQWACRACAIHFSARSDESIELCGSCQQPLEEWDDLVGWRPPGITHSEVVEGACPRCQTPLVAMQTGNWD